MIARVKIETLMKAFSKDINTTGYEAGLSPVRYPALPVFNF
jgi:hypothetical protein